MELGARYREFAASADLREYVRAFFTFTVQGDGGAPDRAVDRERVFGAGERYFAPLFADGHASIVFTFGEGARIDGLWDGSGGGHVIGAMSVARAAAHGDRTVQVGAYLRAGKARVLTGVAATELTDRIVGLGDAWGSESAVTEQRLYEAGNDGDRVRILEAVLRARLVGGREARGSVNVAGLAGWVVEECGGVTVERMAEAAGISRQHLTRVFRDEVGVSPKLYARLARFRAGLAKAGRGADAAAEMGYTDQSHMIAEFREFSGLTPGTLVAERRFHPFIEGH